MAIRAFDGTARRLLTASLLLLALWASGCRRQTATSSPGRGSDAGPRFRDVAAQAGIDYRWSIAGKRPLNILQTIGNGCAFLDYDNDGNLDLLLVGPQPALYRGDGHGHFVDVSRETGIDRVHGHLLGCAVGDYDNDGYPDIYMTAYRGGVLLHNDHGRRFVDVTASSGIPSQPWATSAAFVDVDRDGRLDLYICNYAKFGPTDTQLCGNNGIMTSCGPRFYQPEMGHIYRNLGGGRFQNADRLWNTAGIHGKGLGVACADFDASGFPSIALANDEAPGDLLHNRKGRFSEIGVDSCTAFNKDGSVHGGMGVDWGDYDGDGSLDLAVGTFQNEAKCIYHNDGNGIFTESSGKLGLLGRTQSFVTFGVKFLDYDNDGRLDLILANGHVQDNIAEIDRGSSYRQPTVLLHNEGGRNLRDVSARAGEAINRPIVGRGLAVGDYDNDGRVDVLLVDSEGSPLLLHNETETAGHWLSIRLEGSRSNRDGIGARVTVAVPGGNPLVRYCSTDGSYMSASDRRVHVGLGDQVKGDITVRWPSGLLERFAFDKPDQIVTLREGAGKSIR